MYKKLKTIITLLIMGIAVSSVSAQAVLKLGGDPYKINEKAALDVESTTRGFLPPRMTKAQRNLITSPPAGLQVWCTDCNISTEPASGQLCIYLGSGWAPIMMNSTAVVTTGKKSDANKPVFVSTTSATINGILAEVNGAIPTETGFVYKSISGDFATLPTLDASGTVTSPNVKKTTSSVVTTPGGAMTATVSSLSATPYYYRAYAKSDLGIGYGNTVILNCAAPSVTAPNFTDTTLNPKFNGTLTVNAGTLPGAITEYGYCNNTTTNPTVANNKVVLSTPASLAALDATLASETFTSNPTVSLSADNYVAPDLNSQYFRFYVIANGVTYYSPTSTTYSPTADPITGGTAIATVVSSSTISPAAKIEVSTSGKITVTFNVTKAGTYNTFTPAASTGSTTGLSLGSVTSGNFAIGTQTIDFTASGIPAASISGCTWSVPRIGTLSSGTILKGDNTGSASSSKARCYDDLYNITQPVPITSATNRVWMDRNLGAYRVAASANDSQAYGCMFQWGRGNDGHANVEWTGTTTATVQYSTSSTTVNVDVPTVNSFIITSASPYDWRNPKNDLLWQGSSGINNPCPSGYRVPTIGEINAEIAKYNITNISSAFNSIFKFAASGQRNSSDGSCYNGTNRIMLRGSTVSASPNDTKVDIVYITSTGVTAGTLIRGEGAPVRCIQN